MQSDVPLISSGDYVPRELNSLLSRHRTRTIVLVAQDLAQRATSTNCACGTRPSCPPPPTTRWKAWRTTPASAPYATSALCSNAPITFRHTLIASRYGGSRRHPYVVLDMDDDGSHHGCCGRRRVPPWWRAPVVGKDGAA